MGDTSAQLSVVAQVKTVELKPPQDIVEAIQQSEDGSTAPPQAEVRVQRT